MLKRAILFMDYERTTTTDRYSACKQMNECLGILGETMDFFTSGLEDLATISKYRVVSLPTFILLDERGRVLFRSLRLPEHDELRNIAASLAG